ncbi:MAG: helix-turn-helix domain-containing protein, partial [Candidatus Dormibacteraceae bacterium]
MERQELAAELTRLRHRAGLSGQAIAERLGVSQSKISKMENGHIAITVEEAKQWGRAVGCDQGTIEELGRRADTALTEMISWRGSRHLSDVLPKFQRNIGALEHTATLVQE